MTLHDFMGYVLPDEGIYCAAAISGGVIEHVYLASKEDLLAVPEAVEAADVNIYYTPATFVADEYEGKEERRNQSRVCKVRSVWLDVDAGKANDKKSYKTKSEARDALLSFIEDSGLPIPMIVDSGHGYHAYWAVDRDMTQDEWAPLAKALRKVAEEHGLKVDGGCTIDSARLMRFPGTINYREGEEPVKGRLVKIKHECPVGFDELRELLGADTQPANGLGFEIPEYVKQRKLRDPVAASFVGKTNFNKILHHKTPCQQVVYMVENRATLEEPMWRAGLSIAQICEDRDEAIRAISEDYPGYSFEDADRKASKTNGPYTCGTFEGLNPEGCKGCPHWGKITTPAQLGKVVPAAESEEDRKVTVVVEEREAHTSDSVWKPVVRREVETLIPEYPFPFFRPKDGCGVFKMAKGPDGEDEPVMVCEYDFYVTRRVNDPDTGEALWFRLHLPQDGIREFSLPLTTVVATDKLRDALAQRGIVPTGKNSMHDLFLYVAKWLRHFQMNQKAEQVRSQMGWTLDGTFVVGTREMVPGRDAGDSIIYCPPASRSQYVSQHLSERGNFHEWKKVIDFYNNEGMEAYAFAVFLSFGSPLLQFTPLRGGVYNMVSAGSGAGKTTALMAANSIWGHPTELMMKKDDTYNARIHRAGVLQHLPITVDEITNMEPRALSDMVYASTSGKGKNRMEASSNNERLNLTSWQAPTLCTSNASIRDKLLASKSFPEGELMRVIEVEVKRMDTFPKAYTDTLFASLERHHGMAWVPYMHYIINNQNEVIDLLRQVQEKTDKSAGLTQRERIWSALAAVALTGGSIAYGLGLHSIDVKRIARWVSTHMMNASVSITASTTSPVDALAEYMAENYNNTLIIKDNMRGLAIKPDQEPRGQLTIRVEPDTRKIFIVAAPFRKWCNDRQISYHNIVDSLRAAGIIASHTKKRVAKGTSVSAPPVSCIEVVIPRDASGAKFGLGDVLDEPDDTGTED